MPEFSLVPISQVPTRDRHSNGGHQWTDAERELVRQWYGKIDSQQLADRLGVTTRALSQVACYQGITRPRSVVHVWTEEEDDILRREYQQTYASRDHLAYKLGLSINQVQHRLSFLGLCKHTDRRPWTPAEDQQLTRLMEQGKNRYQIARTMKRTVNSVVIRTKRYLHLRFRDRTGWYTKNEVCEILGVDHHWVQRRIDSGALKASWHHGHRPQKNGSRSWHIAEGALINFIRTYPQDLNGRNVDLVTLVNLLVAIQSHPLEEFSDHSLLHYRTQGWTYRQIAKHYGRNVSTVWERMKKLKAPEQPDRNRRKRAFCRRGHELTADNLYVEPGTKHQLCRACLRLKEQRLQERRRQKQREATQADVAD